MKLSYRELMNVMIRPTLLPRFLSPAIFLQVRDYHKHQHDGRLGLISRQLLGREYDLVMKERVIEIAFAHRELRLPPSGRVMEFGCYASTLSMELASLGYEVTGVDLRLFPMAHPSFNFMQGDFLQLEIPESYFDAVVAISAIEHAGLGAYEEGTFERGDVQIARKILSVLKPGGRFIVSVPYGKPAVSPTYRVYDAAALDLMMEGFENVKREYFVAGPGRQYWLPCEEQELRVVDSVEDGWIKGTVCAVGRRPQS